MEALYAFMRISDDLADEPGEAQVKAEQLQHWRGALVAALQGHFNHPVHPALLAAVRRFDIPAELLFDALDGVEADLVPVRFATFADLYPYCYRVASAVGLACVRIWGFRANLSHDERCGAIKAAEAAGIALQLTNILRDLSEDWSRGRVYLPADELARFEVSPQGWPNNRDCERLRSLMEFQIGRAKEFFCLARPLEQALTQEGRAIARVMIGTYRQLLSEIEKDALSVLTRRMRVPSWRKGLILAEGWAIKWGVG
jgi:phytoene synthase